MFFGKKPETDFGLILKKPKNGQAKNNNSRRAVSLVPIQQGDELIPPTQPNYQQMLVSLEGKQSTMCMRIISPGRKSRAAVMVFKGRVVGCIYGSKQTDGQIWGQEAHRRTLAELALSDNVLESCELSEEIMLAASSLFHGQVVEADQTGDTAGAYMKMHNEIVESNMPGMIVVGSPHNIAVAMVYYYKGQIVGAFSHETGWLSNSLQNVLNCVRTTQGAQLSATVLRLEDPQDLESLTFSLSGLGDRDFKAETKKVRNTSKFNRKEITEMRAEELRAHLELSGLRDALFSPSGNIPQVEPSQCFKPVAQPINAISNDGFAKHGFLPNPLM